jgi:hypothetical protein
MFGLLSINNVLTDNDGNGEIDYRELLSGLALVLRGTGEETLRFCFQMYDWDNSGSIGEHELFVPFSVVAFLQFIFCTEQAVLKLCAHDELHKRGLHSRKRGLLRSIVSPTFLLTIN